MSIKTKRWLFQRICWKLWKVTFRILSSLDITDHLLISILNENVQAKQSKRQWWQRGGHSRLSARLTSGSFTYVHSSYWDLNHIALFQFSYLDGIPFVLDPRLSSTLSSIEDHLAKAKQLLETRQAQPECQVQVIISEELDKDQLSVTAQNFWYIMQVHV